MSGIRDWRRANWQDFSGDASNAPQPQVSEYSPDYIELRFGGAWQTEPPTEPGWYWAYYQVIRDIELICIQVVTNPYGGPLLAEYGDCNIIHSASRWLGPLPVPNLPE